MIRLTRLRDGVALVDFCDLNVRILDPTVCVEILSEIGARHGLVQLTLNEGLIGLGNRPIGVGVAPIRTVD